MPIPNWQNETHSPRSRDRCLLDIGSADERSRYARVPIELKLLRAWLPFRTELRLSKSGNPETLKIPYNVADRKAHYTNPRQWMTFDDAYTMLRRGCYDGLGIVLDQRFGIVGYDADSCISHGKISETALRHITTLNSYAEESYSGTGCHCLAYGTLPPYGRKGEGLEMYCHLRFFVITGRHIPGTPSRIEHRQAEIELVHSDIFGREPTGRPVSREPQSVTQFRPITQVCVIEEEKEVGARAFRSDEQVLRNLKGDRVAWRYFAGGCGEMNPSRADFALGCKLAFYTGGDLDQMYRLFMQSALGKREKCRSTRRDIDYVRYTLKRCLARQRVFWRPFVKAPRSKNRVGRPLSTTTQRVQEARSQFPDMRASELARMLGLRSPAVRKVLSRYPSQCRTPEKAKEFKCPEIELTPAFSKDSVSEGTVLEAMNKYSSWVKVTTLATKTGKCNGAVAAELERLAGLDLVDRRCDGRYRVHREQKRRTLKPCRLKPIPKRSDNVHERRTLTKGELRKRGWQKEQIEKYFPIAGRHYREKEILLEWNMRMVKIRLYQVSRIKVFERQPDFEVERAEILQRDGKNSGQPRKPSDDNRVGGRNKWEGNVGCSPISREAGGTILPSVGAPRMEAKAAAEIHPIFCPKMAPTLPNYGRYSKYRGTVE